MNEEYGPSGDTQVLLSKINSAGLLNSLMHNLWLDFNKHYRAGRYLSANADLDCMWIKLGGEEYIIGSPDEAKYQALEEKLADAGQLQDALTVNGFSKPDEKQLEKFYIQRKILMEKALFIQRLQNSQGKGTAYDYSGDDEESE